MRTLIGLMLAASLLAPAAAPAQELPGFTPAAQTLSRCVQTNERLAVVLLVDESGSLGSTDPLNERVDGLRAALTGLARLANTPVGERKPVVDVLFSSFSGRVRPDPGNPDVVPEWRAVNQQALDQLLKDAGEYARRNFGRDTDYATAMTAARRMLAARVTEVTKGGDRAVCKAIVWFTDGRYSIEDRTDAKAGNLPTTLPYAPGVRIDRRGGGERAVAAGKRYLCRGGGLMDDLVGDGVVKFTVALSRSLSPADGAFLEAMTTGRSGGTRCGRRLSEQTGAYLSVQDSADLFFGFSELFTGRVPPGPVVPVCERKVCDEGIASFRTVPDLNSFLIHASTGTRGVALSLTGPDGQAVDLLPSGPKRLTLSGATLIVHWVSDRALEVEGVLPEQPGDWTGRWTFAFVDPSGRAKAPPAYTIQLFSDLVPVLRGRPSLTRGETTGIEFDLKRRSGAPARAGGLAESAEVTATLIDPAGGEPRPVRVERPRGDGPFVVSADVPLETTSTFLFLDLETRLKTPDGVQLSPTRRSFQLRLPPGEGFPEVQPGHLRLKSIEGEGFTEGRLTVTGSPAVAGCVWLQPAKLDAPADARPVRMTVTPAATAPERCVEVAAGEQKTITVRFTPSGGALGSVSGSLPVRLRSADAGREVTIDVRTSFELAPEPDVAKRVSIMVILTLLGALLPLLLLHLLNWWGARFTAPQQLSGLGLDVSVDPVNGLRALDGTKLDAPYGRFEPLSRTGSVERGRTLSFEGFDLRAIASGNVRDRVFRLFRGPYGVATAGDQPIVVGTERGQTLNTWRDGRAHEVPVALAGTWLFRQTGVEVGEPDDAAADPQAPQVRRVTGRLALLISEGPDLEQGQRLLQDAGLKLKTHPWQVPVATETPEAEPDRPSLLDRLRRNGSGGSGESADAPDSFDEPWDTPSAEAPAATSSPPDDGLDRF